MEHVHRWNLEPSSGGLSEGSCLCGEARTFTGGFDPQKFSHSERLTDRDRNKILKAQA